MPTPNNISNTRLATFTDCRMKYQFQYIDHVKTTPTVALRRGNAGHLGLAAFYEGREPADALQVAIEAMTNGCPADQLGSLEKDVEQLEMMLSYYFSYSQEFDSGWNVLAVETTKHVELWGRTYMGILDLIVENQNGDKFVVDHKFSRSHSDISHYGWDTQMQMYAAMMSLDDESISGVLVNVLPVLKTKAKDPVRLLVQHTKEELQNFLLEMRSKADEIELLHKGQLPVYRSPGASCKWTCSYLAQCQERMKTAPNS